MGYDTGIGHGHNFCQLMLVGISDDEVDARQSRNLLSSALGITAGDDDFRLRILPAHPAYGGSRILVGAGRDRAGIQNYHRSMRGRRSANHPLLFELAFKSGAIGLRGATAKILYKKSGHNLW